MLSNLNADLKKIILAGIGAVAATAEKSEELLKELIRKGEITVEEGKVLNEELKRNTCKKSTCCQSGHEKHISKEIDIDTMTKEERMELKRRLEELEKNEKRGKQQA